MFSYAHGTRLPIEVQPGDILFLSAKSELSQVVPPYEHVAIAADHRSITSPQDFVQLPYYGMPESRRKGSSRFALRNGKHWLDVFAQQPQVAAIIGSPVTVWNLIGRSRRLDKANAAYLGRLMAVLEGTWDVSYQSDFRVDPTTSQPIQTNCLGFVCSIFERIGIRLIAHSFPRYAHPYKIGSTRVVPSPGHLAYSILKDRRLAFRARDQAQAEILSKVQWTLRRVLARHLTVRLPERIFVLLRSLLRN